MIIEFAKDNHVRKCAICKNRIHKGKILVKYQSIIDQFKNSRMWFAHIDCLIKKLNKTKNKFENIVPKEKLLIERYDELRIVKER